MRRYKLIWISAFLLSLILACSFKRTQNEDYESIANRLRDKISEEIQQKYHVRQFGTRGGMYQCVRLLGLAFFYNNPILQDEARSLLIPMLLLFQQRINENKEIRPYLQKYPFPIENIQLSIYVKQENGQEVYDPYVQIITFTNGLISYSIYSPDNQYQEKEQYIETFEEAVEKLKQQSNHDKI